MIHAHKYNTVNMCQLRSGVKWPVEEWLKELRDYCGVITARLQKKRKQKRKTPEVLLILWDQSFAWFPSTKLCLQQLNSFLSHPASGWCKLTVLTLRCHCLTCLLMKKYGLTDLIFSVSPLHAVFLHFTGIVKGLFF